jgi:hypothetical protein
MVAARDPVEAGLLCGDCMCEQLVGRELLMQGAVEEPRRVHRHRETVAMSTGSPKRSRRPVIALVGDGPMQMNGMAELITIAGSETSRGTAPMLMRCRGRG